MRTFKLTLAYDGTELRRLAVSAGPAHAARHAGTAHGKRSPASRIRVVASGRTDAGVHALGQVVSFRSADASCRRTMLLKALNAELPRDMAVLEVAEAPDGFHATRCAKRKRYRYVIDDGPIRDVFRRQFAWHYRQPLDAAAMHRAAPALVGTHDFSQLRNERVGTRNERAHGLRD